MPAYLFKQPLNEIVNNSTIVFRIPHIIKILLSFIIGNKYLNKIWKNKRKLSLIIQSRAVFFRICEPLIICCSWYPIFMNFISICINYIYKTIYKYNEKFLSILKIDDEDEFKMLCKNINISSELLKSRPLNILHIGRNICQQIFNIIKIIYSKPTIKIDKYYDYDIKNHKKIDEIYNNFIINPEYYFRDTLNFIQTISSNTIHLKIPNSCNTIHLILTLTRDKFAKEFKSQYIDT
jgi:hypothetical protein